jgi:mutator protein MutT
VFNGQGDVYLQKRPEWKDIQPGKWDTAVGGHIDYGETPEEALQREVREELGITDFLPEFVDKYVFESQRERELVYVHRTTYEGEITSLEERTRWRSLLDYAGDSRDHRAGCVDT